MSKYGDRITFLHIGDGHKLYEVYVDSKIVDICLHDQTLLLLHESSVTVYDLVTRSSHVRNLASSSRPVSMEANNHVLAVLDQTKDVTLYSMSG